MLTRRLVLLTAALAITLSSIPCTPAQAEESDLQSFGDAMQIVLPAVAGISTFFTNPEEGQMWDKEGTKQFAYAFGSSWTVTYVLKIAAGKMRPNGDNRTSFPSGHTMAAFSGASFIDARYGRWWGIPAYAAAVVTGYSRVESQWHYVDDVLAGGSIGMMGAWMFVTPQPGKIQLVPTVGAQGMGFAATINPGAEEDDEPWTVDERRTDYRFTFGPADAVFNRVQSNTPGSTPFNLSDLEGVNNPTTTAGITLGVPVSKRGRVNFNYAPFEARDRGQFGYDVTFDGVLYTADQKVESAWRFYQVNAFYSHHFPLGSRFGFTGGLGLGSQQSYVALSDEDGGRPTKVEDDVVYGLVGLGLDYQIAHRWNFSVALDGVIASKEWSDNVSAELTWQANRHWDMALGYNYFSRMIDTDTLRNEVDYRIPYLAVTRYW